ncbi:MAG TPA: hypothetical protein VJ326_03040 [Thermoplasmata archaeon]|nr:hypothetical protein [Thermoplasmata archaeon]
MRVRVFLYLLLWLALAQIALALVPIASSYIVDAHAGVGIAVVGLAHMNFAKLRRSRAPDRLKRIARATAILATAQLALGLALFAAFRLGVAVPGTEWIGFVHAIIALGILAETASVATAHDMWEKAELGAGAP